MTYRYVAYDIERILKKNFDDSDITLNQIIYWIMVVANKIRYQHNSSVNTDMFTSTYCPVEIKKDSKGRQYVELPTAVMSLANNAGIVSVSYNVDTNSCKGPAFAQTFFQSVNYSEVHHLYLDEYTKPHAKSPYFYRVGDSVNGVNVNRLYLLGLECVDAVDLEIALKSTINPKQVCNLDDEIPVPDEFIQMLTSEVLELARFGLMMPEERANIGEDASEIESYYPPTAPSYGQTTQSE